MFTITLANLKGGVGKTSLAINLAAGLTWKGTKAGWKVLLVDLDPQCNALRTISGTTNYTNVESVGAAICDDQLLELLSLPRASLSDLVKPAPEPWYPGLYFVPSRQSLLVEVRRRMPAMENRIEVVQKAFGSLSQFDFVVVDTGPTIDDLLASVLSVTDFVLVPVEMDEDSLEGAASVTKKVLEIAKVWGRPSKCGYVANKVDQRRIGDRNALEILRRLFGDLVLQAEIPQSIEVRYSRGVRSDIFRFKPESAAAVAMANMVDEVVKRTGVRPMQLKHSS